MDWWLPEVEGKNVDEQGCHMGFFFWDDELIHILLVVMLLGTHTHRIHRQAQHFLFPKSSFPMQQFKNQEKKLSAKKTPSAIICNKAPRLTPTSTPTQSL